MCHPKHRLRFFLFRRKIMFCSQDIQVFVFLTIPWFTKSVTSRWVLVHEKVHFLICLLNHKSWRHQTWPVDSWTVISTFSNFVPNKLVTFNDKEDPPWKTQKLKEKIKWKHKVYRDYLKMVKLRQTICMYIMLEPKFPNLFQKVKKVLRQIINET